jgi:hypothetical protein
MVRPHQQETKMFASMTRKIVTIAAVSLTAATLSLSLVPAAQAGGISFSFGGGDIAIGVMGGGHHKFRDSDEDDGDHSIEGFNRKFDKLNAEDDAVHGQIEIGGYNVLVQQKHDCLTVRKIKLLLKQMQVTLDGYEGLGDTDGVTYQTNLMGNWTDRLHDAEKACNKAWY